MRKVVLVVGFWLVAVVAQAQVFRPGWVLLAQGDTLHGQVEDVAWEDAPTQVRFRQSAGEAIQAYAPADVRAFRLVGGRFFRYETLPLDRTAQTALHALSYSRERNQHPEAFLAEVLVDGPASLLQTSVNSVQHYFVRREGHPVLELAARNYLQQKDGRQLIMSDNKYQAELLQYFGDCPAAVQAIGSFKAAALVGVVQAYNRQCATPPHAGTEYQPQRHRSGFGYALGVVAGGRYGSCQLQDAGAATTLAGANLDGVVHPVAGAYIDVLTPGRHGALHVAGLLTRIGRRGALAIPGNTFVVQVDNQVDILEIRLGGRYFWADTRRGQRFFVGTGLTVAGTLGEYQPSLVYYDANQQRLAQDYVPDAYPHSALLPYLEAGVQHGRLTLALDGRIQARKETSIYSSNAVQTSAGPFYSFSNHAYTYRNWYLGATVGFALLRAY
jgi:hypothetical protein